MIAEVHGGKETTTIGNERQELRSVCPSVVGEGGGGGGHTRSVSESLGVVPGHISFPFHMFCTDLHRCSAA